MPRTAATAAWTALTALVVFSNGSTSAQANGEPAPAIGSESDSVARDARDVRSETARRNSNASADSRISIVVSIDDRVLSAVRGGDTIFYAPVGVATGMTLSYAGRSWKFSTPRGARRVLTKTADPVWTPPDWHYAEVARENGLRLAHIPAQGARLSNGARLVVRSQLVGLIFPGNARFVPLPVDEHVVFDDKLFVPPPGTRNRRITRELGRYALNLGGGYLIHGTPDPASVGQASTHGCLRMRPADLAWIFANVPVGATVTIR